jgi:hypothetical protein
MNIHNPTTTTITTAGPRRCRRATFAEILLTAAPVELRVSDDGQGLVVGFATRAELRAWLTAAGLATPDVPVTEVGWDNDQDGRRYRSWHAFSIWHGWRLVAMATEPETPTVAELPAAVLDQLTQLAGVPA